MHHPVSRYCVVMKKGARREINTMGVDFFFSRSRGVYYWWRKKENKGKKNILFFSCDFGGEEWIALAFLRPYWEAMDGCWCHGWNRLPMAASKRAHRQKRKTGEKLREETNRKKGKEYHQTSKAKIMAKEWREIFWLIDIMSIMIARLYTITKN